MEQLGFRKVIDSTFMMASMISGEPDPEDVRKYFRALRRAQRDIDLRPELYTRYYKKEFPIRFLDQRAGGVRARESSSSRIPRTCLRNRSSGSRSTASFRTARWAPATTRRRSFRWRRSKPAGAVRFERYTRESVRGDLVRPLGGQPAAPPDTSPPSTCGSRSCARTCCLGSSCSTREAPRRACAKSLMEALRRPSADPDFSGSAAEPRGVARADEEAGCSSIVRSTQPTWCSACSQ